MFSKVLKLSFLGFVCLLASCTSTPEVCCDQLKDGSTKAAAPVTTIKMDFLLKGKIVKSLTLEEMQKISPKVDYTVTEPHMNVKKTYEAVALTPILDSVYGKKWRTMKDIEFTCLDGYKPVYLANFFKKYNPHLAFAEKGATAFQITKPLENNKVAELAPFYLVWDFAKYPAAEKMGLSAWAYQLVAFDLK